MGPFVHRLGVVLLAVLLAVIVTNWALTFSARRTPSEPVRVLPAGEVEGQASQVDVAPIARLLGATAPGESSPIRALGVMAEDGTGQGIALLAVEGQPAKSYRSGDAVAPGVVLKEVRKNGVVLSRSGALQELRVPTKSAPPPSTAAPTTAR